MCLVAATDRLRRMADRLVALVVDEHFAAMRAYYAVSADARAVNPFGLPRNRGAEALQRRPR
jgi:hypothetical protein